MISRNRVLMAFALAACVAVVTAACGGSSGYSSSPSTMPMGTGGGGTATADVTVQIVGMNGANSFSPNPVSVKAGQTVAWHNADMVVHTATGASFDTGVVSPGSTSAPIKFDIVAVNLDPYHKQSGHIELSLEELGLDPAYPFQVHELLSNARYLWTGARNFVELDPASVPAQIFRVRRRVRTEREFEYFL